MRERSLGEIAEDLDRLRHHVDARMAELAAKLQVLEGRFHDAPFVRNDLHSVEMKSLRNDISKVSADISAQRQLTMWLLGLLISAIVGAVIVLVITAGRGGGV